MTYDVMIKNGTIVDGTGAPSYVGDVAISDDKIVAVGEPAALYDLQGRGSLVPGAFADINVIDFDALKLCAWSTGTTCPPVPAALPRVPRAIGTRSSTDNILCKTGNMRVRSPERYCAADNKAAGGRMSRKFKL